MSLRWRIAIGLAVIAALVSALAAAGAYFAGPNQLQNSIDDSLIAGARTVTLRAGPRDNDGRPNPFPFGTCPPPGVLQPAGAAQVIDSGGTATNCIVGGPELPVSSSDRKAADEGDVRLRTVTIDGTQYRLLTAPQPDGGLLQVARSLEENENVLASLRLQLAVLSLIGIAAAAILGWVFARRIVRPIERLRDTAERIARTQDLEAPIPQSGGGEVGSLAGSLSTMVGALAVSKRQQQQLVTDASHELRTPLTSLRTNAELLDRAGTLNPEQRERAVQGIRLEVNELTDLVSELVELATDRADDEAPEPVGLAPLADDVAERTRRRTGRAITVTIEAEPATVLVGPHAADRVLANLVDNAVKYSPGAIEIVVAGNRVEVRDEGPGISPSDQPHVFDRFYRSAEARTEPGSGLGLAIVAQLVERHGGSVWATNRARGGAAVGFELPAVAVDAALDREPGPVLTARSSEGRMGRMDFGIFMAPFHPVGQNPTLALERDLELIQHLDRLGYDEAWVGEHHSAGYEIIASPEVFIGIAAERTKHIRLGTGVSSLPYHHPLLLADRMVMLDHLTRGRTMLGCGPGQLTSDAHMLGIPSDQQRPRMEESLDAIMALLRGETVTMETDGFILRDARLQLAPYSDPCFDIAVAASFSPTGARAAGKHGIGMLSVAATAKQGMDLLGHHWNLWEEIALENGHVADRSKWRLVGPMHLAETREQAEKEVEYGIAQFSKYFTHVLPAGPVQGETAKEIIENNKAAGFAVIGTPEDAIAKIDELIEASNGGFGSFLFFGHDWATPAATLRSAELFAQYVMPKYKGQLAAPASSCDWVTGSGGEFVGRAANAIAKAIEDHAAERADT